MYQEMTAKNYRFSFYQHHVSIDCDFSREKRGASKKRHQKAYGDLMHLVSACPVLVEKYFSVELTAGRFEALCFELYTGKSFEEPQAKPIAPTDAHIHPPHPQSYSFHCIFTDAQIAELHRCIEGHEIFETVTEDDVRAFFAGTLTHPIRCKKNVRLGYLLRALSLKQLITNEYQAAVARCGNILSARKCVPMTQKHMQDAVHNAGGYATTDDRPWKRTIDQCIDQLVLLASPEHK